MTCHSVVVRATEHHKMRPSVANVA